jgi:hypothetical protein
MIATRFHPGNHSNILGYNIINEPWAGNVYKVSFTKGTIMCGTAKLTLA